MNRSTEHVARPAMRLTPDRTSNRNFTGLGAGLLLLLAGAPLCQGAPGDLVAVVPLPTTPGFGVSVAVDCDGNVYYTQQQPDDAHLYKMNKNGTLLANPVIRDSVTGAELFMDEMSWDNGRKVLWAGQHNSNPTRVYKVNPTTGTATLAFVSQSQNIGTFLDGIAYDASDDSIWISTDISTTIEHYRATDGVRIGILTPRNASGGTLGDISGVCVGVGDQLYLGQDGLKEIVRVRKSDGAFISSFHSPGGVRDEGLECDSVNFPGKTVLWSRDAGDFSSTPGFMEVIELEPGTCACQGPTNPPPLFAIRLAPERDTNEVGTAHTVCATVTVVTNAAGPGAACTIGFTHTGSGSGTIGTHTFNNAAFTISEQAATANRMSFPGGFSIDDMSASISIAGVGNFHFASGTRTFVNNSQHIVGFSRAGTNGTDLFNGPSGTAFASWDMRSPIGPINGTGGLLQWGNEPVTTDGGTLFFQNASSSATFRATLLGCTNPVVGTTVIFAVTNGPNVGVTGTAVTDPQGSACFTYTGTGGAGTDIIDASFLTPGGVRVATFATKVWVPPPCQLSCADITVCSDAGQCSALVNYPPQTNASHCTVVCDPPDGSALPVGTNTVACTATDGSGNILARCSFSVIVNDCEAPQVACRPAPNPSGKKIPPGGKNGQGGTNPDGFFQLLSKDNCDPAPAIFVKDAASDFIAGPFANGDIVKINVSSDEDPFQEPGPLNVVAHIRLKGHPLLYAVDAAGNVSAPQDCLGLPQGN